MAIGTSNGNHYEDMFSFQAGLNTIPDDNSITPDDFMGNKGINNDPGNITDDQGNIVDYSTPDQLRAVLDPNHYNTPLTPEQYKDYDSKFGPDASRDYDMQGWYKANPDTNPHQDGVHYPDTFKKPNHPTFSDESIYNDDQHKGGHWSNEDGKDVFTPGPQNLKTLSAQELRDYFNKVEPDVKLNLPENSQDSSQDTLTDEDRK